MSKKVSAVFGVLLAMAFSSVCLAEVNLPTTDQTAIKQTALDYAQGWYAGDRAQMGRSLHEDLAKRAYLPNEDGSRYLLELNKTTLLEANVPEHKQQYADKPRRAEVEILDGFGDVATVRLQMDGWVDYMHVVREPGGQWQIINVLWELNR